MHPNRPLSPRQTTMNGSSGVRIVVKEFHARSAPRCRTQLCVQLCIEFEPSWHAHQPLNLLSKHINVKIFEETMDEAVYVARPAVLS